MSMTDPQPPAATKPNPSSSCTPLEQEVLDEYARLLSNLQKLSTSVSTLADRPTAEILDGLRLLERKTSLVCTLLKASVYSIVLQQQIYGGEEEG
ncbi:MAG: hypothetical protein L6R38_009654 [Xanthoria sp. 2 TBL-2021]|nr:MAG: hypothetical protein L6R38_009654 [Xanthoria sp. 2 TBL-2021]